MINKEQDISYVSKDRHLDIETASIRLNSIEVEDNTTLRDSHILYVYRSYQLTAEDTQWQTEVSLQHVSANWRSRSF